MPSPFAGGKQTRRDHRATQRVKSTRNVNSYGKPCETNGYNSGSQAVANPESLHMHRDHKVDDDTDTDDTALLGRVDLARLIDVLPCGAMVLDAEHRILAANRIISDLLDGPRGFSGRPGFDELVADPIEPEEREHLKRDLRAPAAHITRAFRLRAGQGRTLDAVVRFSHLASDAVTPPHLLAILVEYRPAGDSATVPRPANDEAQAFAGVADWEIDIATGRVLASRHWYEIWGFDPNEDVMMDAVLQRIHPDDRDQSTEAVRQAIETGTDFRFRHRIIRPDGVLRWAESAGRVDPLRPDGLRTLSGVVLDITERQAAEAALARYYDILCASPDRIAFVDRGCCVLAANAAFLAAFRQTPETTVGRPLCEVGGHGPLGDLVYRNLGRCLNGGHPVVDDIHEIGPDGEVRESEARLFPHRDNAGTVTGIVINVRDVTGVRDTERRLLQATAVYAATSDGVLMTDALGRIVAVNAAFTQLTGYAEAEALGRTPGLLNSQWHTKSFFTRMWRRLIKHGVWEGEIWNRRKDGEIYLQRLSIRRILDARGKVTNYVGIFAERRAAANGPKHVEYLAHYDPLTKLPNRILFDSRLAYALDPSRRNRTPVALFLLDLDRFANVNASLGHQIGDETLRAVGLRLRETIRPADTLARLSGNQFGLLFEGIQTAAEAQEIARRLRSALHAPVSARGHEVFVTMSIGIALDACAGSDTEIMMTHAETALSDVKQGGRDGFRIYSDQPGDASTERQRLAGLLRSGLDKGELELVFEPRVEIETGRWEAAEVRVRWHQPESGRIPAERFVALAESSGMMVELGLWMLAAACRCLQDWLARGVPIRRLALNIAETQLTRFDLVPALDRQLQESGIDPARLELAFPESLLFKHPERVREVFDGLHGLGVGLTLSEVGTGWLAPSMLRRLPVGRLKIHRSFVEALPDSKDDLAVVQALIALAQALDLDVCADGVRDDRQRLVLLNIGCTAAQGELFARPLSAQRFERCLMQIYEPPHTDAPDKAPAPRASG
jgi:diguanylate cyclase (GGDEF)-like protein/PAS domain S-box-containing protein